METVIKITVKESETGVQSLQVEAHGISVIELLGYLQLAVNSTVQSLGGHGGIKKQD